MTMESPTARAPDPISQVVMYTLVIGAISFVAGFVGPLLLSNGNQGPLLGIFITGPLGFLVGGLVGALRVSNRSARLSGAVIAAVWALALAYTWFTAALVPSLIFVLVPLDVLILAASVYLLTSPRTRAQLPYSVRSSGVVVLVTQVIMVATMLYLPVVKPSFGTPGDPPPDPFPSFAFIFDHGFELSQRPPTLPQFVVNRPELVAEWAIVIAVAVVLSLIIRALRRRLAA